MAECVYLFLKANGQDIKGESRQTSLGRENSIECLFYEQAVAINRDPGTGQATGRRQYAPLVVRKPIDRSSPLLMKALTENQVIEATFKFFRPNPSGDGTTEQFYTVTVKQGRIASVKQFVLDTMTPPSPLTAPLEEVTFVFNNIEWIYTNGGVRHTDSFRAV